nr:ATP-dependent DNA helicase PIF1-like [Aedes albopictus]
MNAVIRQRTNVMSKEDYCAMVRTTNAEQRDLILQMIHSLHSYDESSKPMQIFFTGPAGCGKTFTLRILMETINRYSQAHNAQKNAYVACASTGKAAVAIGGTTVHSAFRITMSRRANSKLSFEMLQLYRNAFANIKAVIIDEVSMIGADILNTIHVRLQDISGNYDDPFGGINIVFCGDLRQLPPVNARPVYKPTGNSFHGAVLWQALDFLPLVKVMRQTDVEFSSILTKIGNGQQMTAKDTKLIESRFRTVEWCKQNAPGAIRLYHRNADVEAYNNEVLHNQDALDCIAGDVFAGYKDAGQLASSRIKLYKMSVVETGGLPYLLRLSVGMPYMITTNVDVEDGVVNGAIEIDGYKRITQCKRMGMRAAGVAIYQKETASTVAVPHPIKQLGEDRDETFAEVINYGDICAAKEYIATLKKPEPGMQRYSIRYTANAHHKQHLVANNHR